MLKIFKMENNFKKFIITYYTKQQFSNKNFNNTDKFQTNKEILHLISQNFWKNKPAELTSMCGFEDLNQEDNNHTINIIKTYFKQGMNNKRAIDVGAGIGRITFNSLYDNFENIDMVEASNNFLQIAKNIEKEKSDNKIKNFYNSTIEDFKFLYNYDLIIVQWVLEYVSYNDLISFFTRAKLHLQPNGIIIVKENINIYNDNDICIEEEGSLIRPYKTYEEIFSKSGLNVDFSEMVDFTRKDIYEIKCWILKI
jgi:protein N-terminal methyltransferase